MDRFPWAQIRHLRRIISYPVVMSLPLMEVSLNVRYVIKKGILLSAPGNLVKSSHCLIGQNLGKNVSKFYQLLSGNGGTAASADVEDKVGLSFESLRLKCRDRMNQSRAAPSRSAVTG